MKNPELRKACDELEPAYQIARLRIMRGLTQKQLADLLHTQQPSIARLESGKSSPDLEFLERVASALGARLVVKIEPLESDTMGKPVAAPCRGSSAEVPDRSREHHLNSWFAADLRTAGCNAVCVRCTPRHQIRTTQKAASCKSY